MNRAFSEIVGNRALRERLAGEIRGGSFPHAYIIEGAFGTGKHMLALRIAAALSCENRRSEAHPLPCGTCLSCRKILGGHSTDVIWKNRGSNATFGVDAIREIRTDVYVAPNDSDTKVYILEEAHLLTAQAQNAFLLTLEEPPPYVVFLLLCESATSLLDTVRSRAATIRTEPIPSELIGDALCRINGDAASLRASAPSEFSEIVAASNGSIGRALELLDPKTRRPILQKRQAAREFARICAEHRGCVEALRLLHGFGQKRDEVLANLASIEICLRDLLLFKQTENAPLCFFTDREETSALAYRFTTPDLLRICEAVMGAEEQLRKNANVRLTVTSLAVNAGLL